MMKNIFFETLSILYLYINTKKFSFNFSIKKLYLLQLVIFEYELEKASNSEIVTNLNLIVIFNKGFKL